MSAEDEALVLYERMSPPERQQVLDLLADLYGFPKRLYTTEEMMTAILAII